ncbi:hypothetical protein GCM10010378_46070 [Streptomyces viridochromogenes]
MTEQPSSALWRFVEEDDPDGLTLAVDTPQGTHLRRIPPALPLPSHVDHGAGAEAAAHTAAATWGMPDFVFRQAAHAARARAGGSWETGCSWLAAAARSCRSMPAPSSPNRTIRKLPGYIRWRPRR